MHAIKFISLLPFLISACAAADCYDRDGGNGSAASALSALSYNGLNRRCVYNGDRCKACYRTGGAPRRFGEAVGNIQDQCISGGFEQGYWQADGLRVCYDCTNSGNCNDTNM